LENESFLVFLLENPSFVMEDFLLLYLNVYVVVLGIGNVLSTLVLLNLSLVEA
jgi:hypothetical protein